MTRFIIGITTLLVGLSGSTAWSQAYPTKLIRIIAPLHGLIAPKNLPKPILDRVNAELNKILQQKDMQDKLANDGVSAAGGAPDQFLALIKKDIETWRKVVQQSKVKAE